MKVNLTKSITVLLISAIFLGLLIAISCSENPEPQQVDIGNKDIRISNQQDTQISESFESNQKEALNVLERINNALSIGYSYEGELFMNMIVSYGEFAQEVPLNMKGDVSHNGKDFSGTVNMTDDGASNINLRLVSDKFYINYANSVVWSELPEGQKIISPPELIETVTKNLMSPEYIRTTLQNGEDVGYIKGAIDSSYLGEFVPLLKGSNGNIGADIYIDPMNNYITSLSLKGSVEAGSDVKGPTGEDLYIEIDVLLTASNFGKPVSSSVPQLPPTPSDMQFNEPPVMGIDKKKDYSAKIFIFGGGQINIDLFEDKAPVTVNNFVYLAENGYYDGVTFHRVIPGFMAQTGDPTGTGTGGPGYEFQNEFNVDARHDSDGIVSMANAGIQNGKATNGSQFFIIYGETPFLDAFNEDDSPKDCSITGSSCHSVFGKVTQGMEVVQGIMPRDPSAGGPADVIEKIIIYKE